MNTEHKTCILKGCTEARAKHASKCRKHATEAAREWRKANPDKVAEATKRWQDANPEKAKAYRQKFYEENREELLAKMKEYREANPETVKATQEQWRRDNEGRTYGTPDSYVKYIGYEHPAACKGGLTNYHRIILWDMLEGQDSPCHWCGKQLFWDSEDSSDRLIVDHVNTVKDDNREDNLVPACHRCNVTRPGGRKPSAKTIVGDCEFEGCVNKARAHVNEMKVCGSHYNQHYSGKELTPLRSFVKGRITDEGRECTACREFKSWDNFYKRPNGKHQARCKLCMVALSRRNKEERLARNNPCEHKDCAVPADIKGLCSAHYHQTRIKGDA